MARARCNSRAALALLQPKQEYPLIKAATIPKLIERLTYAHTPVHAHTHTRARTQTHAHARTRTRTRTLETHACMHARAPTHAGGRGCRYVSMYGICTHMSACMHACMCVCVRARLRVCVCVRHVDGRSTSTTTTSRRSCSRCAPSCSRTSCWRSCKSGARGPADGMDGHSPIPPLACPVGAELPYRSDWAHAGSQCRGLAYRGARGSRGADRVYVVALTRERKRVTEREGRRE